MTALKWKLAPVKTRLTFEQGVEASSTSAVISLSP
jgi:hypothetical protein